MSEQIAVREEVWTEEDQELLQDLLAQKQKAPFIRFTQRFGRPTKLTDELIERFIACLLSMSYIDVACKFCSISRDCFYRWMEKAASVVTEIEQIWAKQEKAKEVGREYKLSPAERATLRDLQREETQRLVYFYDRVQQAQSEIEIKLQRHILSAASNSWTAAAWMLERKFPERWLSKDGRLILGDGESRPQAGFAYIEVPPDPNEAKVIDVTPKPHDGNVRNTGKPFKRGFSKKLITAKKRS